MKITIKNQLLFTCIGLTLSIVVAQIIFNLFFLNDYYMNYKENGMIEAFDEIKKNYDGTAESLEASAIKYEDLHNLQILIFTHEDIIYITQNEYLERRPPNRYDSTMRLDKMIFNNSQLNWEYDPFETRSLEEFSESPQVQYIVRSNEERSMISLMGKFSYNGTNIYISLTLPIESIENNVEIFIQTSSTISFVVLSIGVFASILIGKRLTKPINKIEETAFKVANLDFSMELDENISTVELASLSKSINNMSNQLKMVIQELNTANEKLQADVDTQKNLENMRREFVANVSHEMKTPLTLLQMYSENLKNNVDSIDKEYYCDTIIEETEYLHKMVKSMLDISAIESGISVLKYEELSISDLVHQLIDRISLLMEEVNIELDIEENLIMQGDYDYLEQAMKNYITNALAHTEKNKTIKISLYSAKKHIIFSVYNQGQQIQNDDLEHLWESFYKSDKARVRTIEGNTGLGLHIVKTIVEKHNGFCCVENAEDGVVFLMEFPKNNL